MNINPFCLRCYTLLQWRDWGWNYMGGLWIADQAIKGFMRAHFTLKYLCHTTIKCRNTYSTYCICNYLLSTVLLFIYVYSHVPVGRCHADSITRVPTDFSALRFCCKPCFSSHFKALLESFGDLVTWCHILLEAVQLETGSGHRWRHLVSSSATVSCGIQMRLDWYKWAYGCAETSHN